MKFGILAFCSLSAMSAWAGDESTTVYDALSVPEMNLTTPGVLDSTLYEKKVGGLICTRVHSYLLPRIEPAQETSSCLIAIEGRDDQAIYHALAVPARSIGRNSTVKKVGNVLECVNSPNDSSPRPKDFRCKLLH